MKWRGSDVCLVGLGAHRSSGDPSSRFKEPCYLCSQPRQRQCNPMHWIIAMVFVLLAGVASAGCRSEQLKANEGSLCAKQATAAATWLRQGWTLDRGQWLVHRHRYLPNKPLLPPVHPWLRQICTIRVLHLSQTDSCLPNMPVNQIVTVYRYS